MNVALPVKTAPKPTVLCVDDEKNVLEGLSLHLRRRYEVLTAPSGADALKIAAHHPELAVVLSDMRMPGMSGAELFPKLREVVPEATRMLLTGHADLESAIDAVNRGQIFRFLTKPCPPDLLLVAFASAAEQNRLLVSERVLLEQTLHGALRALADVLALASPEAFGVASHTRSLAAELAKNVGFEPRWQVEVAAVLGQLGFITLPVELLSKLRGGPSLTNEERAAVERAHATSESLVASIPRLDEVRAIMQRATRGNLPTKASDAATRGAAILRISHDIDELEARGMPFGLAVQTLKGRVGVYAAELISALERMSASQLAGDVLELPLRAVTPGMVFVDDVHLASGALLVARGHEVTVGLVERARYFAPGTVREPVRVRVGSRP